MRNSVRDKPYNFNENWSYHEQWDWLDNNMVKDQYWADTEFTIRKEAMRIQRELHGTGQAQMIETMILRPGDTHTGMESVRVSFMLARVGGVEELLLIEENLRRALAARS